MMEKVMLLKDYSIRHDIIMLKGSELMMSKNRKEQLAENGFVEGKKKKKRKEVSEQSGK